MSVQSDDPGLQPRTALVTGATSGMGKAAALRLALDGFDTIVHGRDASRGAEVVDVIERSGGRGRFVGADLSDPGGAARLAGEVGDVDVLVNNAGFAVFGATAELKVDDFDALFASNVRAPYFLVAALAPAGRERSPAEPTPVHLNTGRQQHPRRHAGRQVSAGDARHDLASDQLDLTPFVTDRPEVDGLAACASVAGQKLSALMRTADADPLTQLVRVPPDQRADELRQHPSRVGSTLSDVSPHRDQRMREAGCLPASSVQLLAEEFHVGRGSRPRKWCMG